MASDFIKLSPSDLHKASVIPQALDNQWVPSNLLSRMIKERKQLLEVAKIREKAVLREWRRALIYSEQIILNRAFLYNNYVISQDYENQSSRESFRKLLKDQSIVVFLLTEEDPTEAPNFNVSPNAFEHWVAMARDTQISCVRLSWGDQRNDFGYISSNFHSYFQRIGSQVQVEHLASSFSIKEQDLPEFKKILKLIAGSAFKKAHEGYITRSDLYREFISEPGTSLSAGLYRNEKFTATIKQIVDLKYNVNLPDILGAQLLTPFGSPSRRALGDLDDGINSNNIDENLLQELLVTMSRITLTKISDSIFLENLDQIRLDEVVRIRESESMQAYRESLRKIDTNPIEFLNDSNRFIRNYEYLNREISQIRHQKSVEKWESMLKFVISVGPRTLELLINPSNPSEKMLTKIATGSISTGTAPFLVSLVADALVKTDTGLGFSIDIMRGTIANGRNTWEELVGQISSMPHVKDIDKR